MALTRKFVDSDGVQWQVYELAGDAVANPRAGEEGWLYFFSRTATRSLAAYPDDWAIMDWPALDRLCQRARPPATRERARPLVLSHAAEA